MTTSTFYRSSLRLLTLAIISAFGLMKSGCDYSLVEEPNIIPALKLTITPQTAELQKGNSLNLSATISGHKGNGAVTWEILGDSTSHLTWSSLTATYAAPAVLSTSPMLVTILVRSVEDTSRFAQAVITVLDTVTGGGTGQISIAITPISVTIAPGQTYQFNATVSGTSDHGVSWRIVTGQGTVSSTGLYAAPSNITATQTTTIEATSVANTAIKATATVKVSKPIDPNLICFERDVMPIFADNCAVTGCHTASNPDPPEDMLLDTYDQIIDAMYEGGDTENKIMDAITEDDTDKRMPLGRAPLSASKIEIIRKWIAQGAKNEACDDPGNDSTDCRTLAMSFAADIKPIMDGQCIGCHQGSNPPKGIDLTTHEGVRSAAQSGQLAGSITHASPFTPMPMAPRQKLDDCTIAKVMSWINAGSPNN